MRRVLTLLLAVAPLSGCGIVFPRSSEVVGLRVLAISAEPPEIIAEGPPPATVTVKALVVDPTDPNRLLEQVWRSCAPAATLGGTTQGGGPPAGAASGVPPVDDTPDGRCSEADAKNQIASATGPLGVLQLDVPVPPDLVAQVAAIGSSGVALSAYLTTQLRLGVPGDPLYAIKRIPIAPPVPAGRKPNRNPHLIGLTFEGEAWEADKPLRLKHDSCPAGNRQTTVDRTRIEEELELCAYKIAPIFDAEDNEEYDVKTFDGSILRNRERIRFQWFAEHGTYSSQRSEEPNTVGIARTDPTATFWREPPAVPEGRKARFWVVMRDGRGGETWTHRDLEWE